MSTRISKHIRSNVLGLVAIFIALGGTAYATHPGGADTISSGDIQDNQVFSTDVRNDTLTSGGLGAADLRPDSVGTSEVANDSLSASDLASSSVASPEVANNSLTGTDIVETSLEGLVRARNTQASPVASCCEIIARPVTTHDPYALFNFATWVDLGNLELRAPTSDNSAGSGFRLCNTSTTAPAQVFIYVGGAGASTSDTRSAPDVGAGACRPVDYNGSDTDADGDFRLYLPTENMVVFGHGLGGASSGAIGIFAIDS
jgi:hypothetical protein